MIAIHLKTSQLTCNKHAHLSLTSSMTFQLIAGAATENAACAVALEMKPQAAHKTGYSFQAHLMTLNVSELSEQSAPSSYADGGL